VASPGSDLVIALESFRRPTGRLQRRSPAHRRTWSKLPATSLRRNPALFLRVQGAARASDLPGFGRGAFHFLSDALVERRFFLLGLLQGGWAGP
jgi:hypothetical protein